MDKVELDYVNNTTEGLVTLGATVVIRAACEGHYVAEIALREVVGDGIGGTEALALCKAVQTLADSAGEAVLEAAVVYAALKKLANP